MRRRSPRSRIWKASRWPTAATRKRSRTAACTSRGAGFAGDGRRPQAGASEAALLRSYEVDLRTGKAVATRMDEKKRWRDDVDVEPGKTFAGIGFIVAVKSLCDQLAPGQKTELKAIAFTPRPRSATVSIIHGGRETVRMAGRSVRADRFDIHPEIPAIARLFVHVPDQHIWLVGEGPPAFLRYEGPLVEPGDPVIRVDLIPGPSAHAQPRARQAPRR